MGGRSTSRSPMRRWPLVAGAVGVLAIGTVAASHFAFAATVFSDNFEDGNTNDWSKSGGTWAVVSDGSRVVNQSNTGTNARMFGGQTSWTAYTVSARVKPISLGSGTVGIVSRASSSTTFYRLALLSNQVQLQAVNSGAVTVLGSQSRTVATNTWYTLAIENSGTSIKGFVNGVQVAAGTSSLASTGRVGLQTINASASYDDVLVATGATTTPTSSSSTRSSSSASSSSSSSRSSSSSSSSRSSSSSQPPTGWPTPTGLVRVDATQTVTGTFDGGLRRYYGIGDGGQSESQDPMFILQPGATLRNVIIGAPAGDGVHCEGNCTLINVWWEDVGEDAATFRGGTAYTVDGGGARSASDKVFQHNGGGTVTIRNFQVENVGKLYRGCGNCTTSYQRHVVMSNITARNVSDSLAGINSNWGDTARFSNITILGDAARDTTICTRYQGVPKGSEPTELGSGPDPVHCLYQASDITWR